MSDALQRLAALCGIEPEYWDIFGVRHIISEDSLRALLRAMGVTLEDVGGEEAALAGLIAEDWSRILPAAQVVREGQAFIELELRLPADLREEQLEWGLRTEQGVATAGSFSPRALQPAEAIEIAGRRYERYPFRLEIALERGYHDLELRGGALVARTQLIVAPATCYLPPDLTQQRVWGPAAQLYALRSSRNWGVGDFTDLVRLVEIGAQAGAGIVGLNPLHALFAHDPARVSPYSPSTRCFYNPIYIDVDAVADLAGAADARAIIAGPDFQAHLADLRATELVDFVAVARVKRRVLELLYENFRRLHLERGTARGAAFREFVTRGGGPLRRFALYQALAEHFKAQDPASWGWPVWPESFRDPGSEAVASFGRGHETRVEFHLYTQWLADQQFAAANERAVELGLRVGLYQDLAVGVDTGGAETWSHPELYAHGAHSGAPPDPFSPGGQDWGLPPLIPRRLVAAAYQPFIDLLRANMRHGRALRIDHVMGLRRLFWVPAGSEPAAGAYVRYPFEDLLGILALESQRHRCLVIGEDLGTVPDEVRAALRPAGVLSYRVFYFEKDQTGDFRSPADYPAQALATISTHDLPTLAGYWCGRDITIRGAFGLFPTDEMRAAQLAERSRDRRRLLRALERAKLATARTHPHPDPEGQFSPELILAVHALLARTPCWVFMFQLEDVLGMLEQVNLPGTVDQYPNWRRKLTESLEVLATDRRFVALTEMLRRERG